MTMKLIKNNLFYVKKLWARRAHFYHDYFFYFFFVGFAFAGAFLNSRYSATMHAYAISADIAVIAPLIKPSENIANNITAKTNTIV